MFMNTGGEEELAAWVGDCLRQRGWRVVTAESCTGGRIAAALTEIPGSSSWMEAGFVTYSNSSKVGLLGVSERLLAEYGAVSAAVVEAMARGALQRTRRADLAVAVSGIAGPTGALPGKPVGTVWLAWVERDGPLTSRTLVLPGDRRAVRAATVRLALEGLGERAQAALRV